MLKARTLFYLQRRLKGRKQRWSVEQHKKKTIDRALENFDDFYASVYGVRWKNIRAALLTEHKYIAMVNNFGDTEKTCSQLEMDGAINLKSLVHLAKERLEQTEENLITNKPNGFDNLLDDIVRKQEDQEKDAIYGGAAAEYRPTEQLQYRDEADEPTTEEEEQKIIEELVNNPDYVHPKKSLDKVLEEDVEIDYSRLIDLEKGTGSLNEYVPATRLKGFEGFIPESDHYKYYQTSRDFPLDTELERDFVYPENLCLYTYEMGNCSDFKSPNKCLTGVLSHYLMDGASILPPLFLDVKLGDRVLDACAAPGGKSLLMLQTLHPETVVCNDIQESRLNRIRKVMREYLFDYRERWEGKRVVLHQSDARNLSDYDSYDKILVDVPCTTDRHSLMENDNNIFKSTRIKERLRLPELQASILTNCLRLLKPGGSLVYSTCSLSPIQNDGVVHMALQKAFSEHNITTTIKDLSLVIRLFSDIYKFEQPDGLKYGQLVLPYLPANFGPMYFCKITRNT